jgi:hypothetical protein
MLGTTIVSLRLCLQIQTAWCNEGVSVGQSLTFLLDHGFKLQTDNVIVFSGFHGN